MSLKYGGTKWTTTDEIASVKNFKPRIGPSGVQVSKAQLIRNYLKALDARPKDSWDGIDPYRVRAELKEYLEELESEKAGKGSNSVLSD